TSPRYTSAVMARWRCVQTIRRGRPVVPVVEAIIAASRLCAGLTGRLAARTGGSSSRCQPSAEASATSRITGTPSSAGTPPASARRSATCRRRSATVRSATCKVSPLVNEEGRGLSTPAFFNSLLVLRLYLPPEVRVGPPEGSARAVGRWEAAPLGVAASGPAP